MSCTDNKTTEVMNFSGYIIPPTVAGAILVMNNVFGVGSERRNGLKEAGFDPVKVQRLVNTLVEFWE